MIISAFVILILHGTKCTSLQFPDLEPQYYHEPIVNNIGVKESILYFRKNNNGMLINSILRDISENHPVLVVSGENITIKKLNNGNPNIILLTETLNIDELRSDAFKTILFSYWSLLHLVVTTKSANYACGNGTLYDAAFAEVKNYLNELWQVFRITQVAVSFPYTCPKHYITYDGKERSGNDVYNRSIKLVKPNTKNEYASAIACRHPRDLTKDYPLRINIFQRFPTSITQCDEVAQYSHKKFEGIQRFCGLDGLIMHDYIEHYKYNVSSPNEVGCDKYGYEDEENNITTGSLGCLLRKEIDISFNSRFMWQYTKEKYFYLYHVAHDSLCVIIQRPSKIPLWHYVYNIFNPIVWIGLLSSLVILGTVTWLSAKISRTLFDEKPHKLHSYLYNSIHEGLFGVLVKNDGRFLILNGSSLLCSIILLGVYQQHFYYQFTTRSFYPEIKTLKELYGSECVLYTSLSILEVLKPTLNEENEAQVAFVKRIILSDDMDNTEYISEHPNTATLARKEDVMIEVLKNYTDKYGMPRMYVLDECLRIYYLSFIARDGFLFLDETMQFMMRLVEAGLPYRYYLWTRRSFKVAEHWPSSGPERRPSKRITLKKLRVAFAFLLVGYLVSGLVFIVERWWYRVRK